MLIIICIAWCVIGVFSVIWDYTERCNFEVADILPALFFGCVVGPIIGLLYVIRKVFGKYNFTIIKMRK